MNVAPFSPAFPSIASIKNYMERISGYADDFFRTCSYSFVLVGQGGNLQGNDYLTKEACQIAGIFDSVRSAINATNWIYSLHDLMTGNIIQKRPTIPCVSSPISTKDAVKSPPVAFQQIDWMNTASAISKLVARILSPIKWFHEIGIYHIPSAASTLTHAMFGLWSIVSLTNLYTSFSVLSKEGLTSYKIYELRIQIWNAIQTSLDLIALPFDFGYLSFTPALMIVGATLNIAAVISSVVKEVLIT